MTFSPIVRDGRKVGVSVFGKDVTRLKSAEEALQRTAEQYREFFEFAPEAIYRITPEGKTVAVNPAGAKQLGYGSPGEAIAGLNDWGRQVWFDPAERDAFIGVVEQKGHARSNPCQFKRKDGTLLWGIMTVRKICGPDGKTLYYQGFLEDITEHMQAEEARRDSEVLLRESQRMAGLGSHVLDIASGAWFASDILREILGVGPDYDLSPAGWMALIHPEDRAAVEACFSDEAINRGLPFEVEHRIIRPSDQAVRWVYGKGRIEHDENGNPAKLRGTIQDITERKAAEEALSNAEQKFREIFEEAPEGIFQTTKKGKSLAMNPAGARMLGFASPEDAVASISDSAHDVWLNPEDRARYAQVLEEKGEIHDFPCQLKRTDGTPIWVSLSARKVCGQEGQTLYYQGFIEDISERRALETDLGAKVRELQVLSEMNDALLHAKTEEELLTEYCRIVVEVGGYRMAWVGFAEERPEKRIIPLVYYGHEDGYLKVANITWADTERGQGPTGRCVRSGEICVCREIAADPGLAPWREEALKRGYMSSIAIPFRHSEGTVACLTAYGVRVSRWSDSERRLMDQVASALGFGITTLRTALAKAQYQESLRVSLEQTIAVIAETVDQRDPYTAGHQRRVADLSASIAGKLGLSSEQTHGLRLAASIHDLGKIGVPAEILARPDRLTENQYNLLKEHAQLGYDIVKKVEFPWPIAQIILQHHERLDGSGYPRGLKADETLLESRILAVADVVEAMSSHRPYRPSRGIDEALDEVLSNSGTLYDSATVEACVNLFRHEGYQFPPQ
jgi:PAS domain S-box-containing protein